MRIFKNRDYYWAEYLSGVDIYTCISKALFKTEATVGKWLRICLAFIANANHSYCYNPMQDSETLLFLIFCFCKQKRYAI